jgi:enediyne biosynthesis protein E4
VANYRRRGVLLRNDFPQGRAWLQVKLVGTRSNRDAVGARLELVSGGVRQVREVRAGDGFMSQSSLVQHFGLGDAQRVDSLTVHWPSGLVQRLTDLVPHRRVEILEGTDAEVMAR